MKFLQEYAYRQHGRNPMVHHRHTNGDTLEILQIFSEGIILLSQQTYPLSPGMLLLIDAAYIHSVNPTENENYIRNKLIVSKSGLKNILYSIGSEELLLPFANGGCCIAVDEASAAQADALFASLKNTPQEDSHLQAAALSCVLQLLQLIGHKAKKSVPPADTRMQAVLQYLAQHFSEEISIERLAEDTHLSKYYLCHLFRDKIGMTVMQYLTEQRLSYARELLKQKEKPISEIAQDCGFCSSSHFCAVFHRREQMTPKEFRARFIKLQNSGERRLR